MDSRPNIALVPVEQDLDATTVDTVRSMLDALIDGGCKRIVLNMASVSYIDSAGIALILSSVRRMRASGGLLSMINVSGQALYALKRSRLVDFMPVSCDVTARRQGKPLDPTTQPLWQTSLPIDGSNLSNTRKNVEQLLERTQLSDDEVFDANLAVGEAMGNAVDHARGCEATVTLTGYPDRVVMEVCDHGPGFSLNEVADRPLEECEERGRGIKMMRLLADSVTIEPRAAGTGMSVRLVKMVGGQEGR